MFSLPDSIIHLIVDYIIPLIPEIRPECKCLSLHYFAYNPNMFFYIRHHGLDMKLVCSSMLSQQQHDDIVTFLVENPEYIDYDLFSRNPHPIAVQYILTHIDQYEAHWVYLSQNTNDDIVLYVLDHPNYINWNYLSANYNDIAVTYLLDHVNHIFWDQFSQNSNSKAIDYLLDHPEYIRWKYFCIHNDERIVQYLLQHSTILTSISFYVSNNTHTDIVHYLLQHHLVDNYSFRKNTNPYAITYIIQHIHEMYMWMGLHPDIRVFELLLKENKNIQYLYDNPHVFYNIQNKEEWETLYNQLL